METPKSESSTPLLSSFKHRITHSLCIPCCFGKHYHKRHDRLIGTDSDSDDDDDNNSKTIPTTRIPSPCSPKSSSSPSSTTLFRRAHQNQQHHHHNHNETLKHFLGSNLSGGLGYGHHHHQGHHHRRRGYSADFRYDAISYALNFDPDGHLEDEFPLSRFSCRLPHSPDKNLSTTTSSSSSSSSSSTTATTTNGHTSPDNNPTTTATTNGHISCVL